MVWTPYSVEEGAYVAAGAAVRGNGRRREWAALENKRVSAL